jgi:choline kinase
MHGLILAGGDGSRLARAKELPAKPLVQLGGRPLIARLTDQLLGLVDSQVACVVREDLREVSELLGGNERILLIWSRTPSSLHSLGLGLANLPPGPVLCTMVDTIMRSQDWQAAHRQMNNQLANGADVSLLVTPYVDDESALYVRRDGSGSVTELTDSPVEPLLVTGGVYGLSPRARALARDAIDSGRQRMRSFLKLAAECQLRVTTVEVPRVIDLDHPSDLEAAISWLSASN